jgi:hypothetical protein
MGGVNMELPENFDFGSMSSSDWYDGKTLTDTKNAPLYFQFGEYPAETLSVLNLYGSQTVKWYVTVRATGLSYNGRSLPLLNIQMKVETSGDAVGTDWQDIYGNEQVIFSGWNGETVATGHQFANTITTRIILGDLGNTQAGTYQGSFTFTLVEAI